MELIKTSEVFEDIKYFKGKFFPDERGFFKKPFYGSNLDDYFKKVSEVLVSKSKKNVIRGLHFQTPPHEVSKIVHCVEGKVKDVFLDLRKDSPTYGKHDSVYLDDDKNITVLIPKGFAHGFSVLSENATVVYLQSGDFNEASDSGIYCLDLGIDWEVDNPVLSEKDQNLAKFSEYESPW